MKTFKQFQILKLVHPDIVKPLIVEFFSLVFSKHEPMSRALKATDKDTRVAFSTIINDEKCNIYLALKKGINSLNDINDINEICGGILAIDLANYMKLDFRNVPVAICPIAAILKEIDQKLNELHPDLIQTEGVALHIPAIAVSELYANQGLGTALYKTVLYSAKNAGYKTVYDEATSTKSQKFQIKMGAEILKEVRYKSFKYGNGYPFYNMDSSECIQLLKMDLNNLSG